MLDPYDRLQLVSELRPPDGYEFDAGIGTTFSLDLESLLTVPLSLALCEFESRDEAMKNPEAVLEGLRRNAGKLHVFCHRSRIKRPKEGTVLFSFLEDMVVQALPKSGTGAFHPKVWVLRYTREEEAMLRVLVLSRNLTFDKSWDTAVVLEGAVQVDRPSGVRKNRRLAQFVRVLADLSGEEGAHAKVALESLADDVMRTEFEVPESFDDIAFWPLGIDTGLPNEILDGEHGRMMIISPFLSDLSSERDSGLLDYLVYRRTSVADNVLVSRPDQLDALTPASFAELQKTTKIYVLDDAALSADKLAQDSSDSPAARPMDDLSGLHAKVYVIENGASVSILAGSANATHAAWGTGDDDGINVEFVVELKGARKTVGIDALLGKEGAMEAGASGMQRMLKPYNRPAVPVEEDADAKRVEKLIDLCWRRLAISAMKVVVSAEEGEFFCPTLEVPPLEMPAEVECRAWPVMLPSSRAQELKNGEKPATYAFGGTSIFAITPFWAFRLRGRSGQAEQVVEFVLRLPVEGMPEGRSAAIISSMINSSDKFLRYLALLLSDDPTEPGAGLLENGSRGGNGEKGDQSSWGNAVLLESLVRAYSRNPKRLERIDALVADLKKGSPSANVVPPEFEEMWQAFRGRQA